MRIKHDGGVDGRWTYAQTQKKTIEDIRNLVFNIVGDDYTVIDNEYIDARTNMNFKHNKCGEVLTTCFQFFDLNQTRCKCERYSKHDTQSSLNEKANGAFFFDMDPKYLLIPATKRKYTSYCLNCNETQRDISRTNALNLIKFGCKCSQLKLDNEYSMRNKIIEASNREIGFYGPFINKNTKSLFYHKGCNQNFWMKPEQILDIPICPYCKSQSRGEDIISSYLSSTNYVFERQKTFEGLVSPKNDKYLLKFDFYIHDFNLIIEFHGRQHFSPDNSKFLKTQEEFEYLQFLDERKKNWALENGYRYLMLSDYKTAREDLISYINSLD